VRIIAALGVASLVLQALAVGPLRTSFWGFHLLAFVPAAVAAGVFAASIAVLVWLVLSPDDMAPRFMARLESAAASRVVLLVLAVTMTAALAVFRSHQTVLGDALPLITDLPTGVTFHPREPLTMFIQSAVYGWFSGGAELPGAKGVATATQSAQTVSIVCGFLFVVVAFDLVRSIFQPLTPAAPMKKQRRASDANLNAVVLLGTLVLVLQGYALLFFGYLENYAIDALLIAVVLASGVRTLAVRLPLAVPLLAAVLAFGLHLSQIALLPALAMLVVSELSAPDRRRAAARDLVIAAVGYLVVDRFLASRHGGMSLWAAAQNILTTATSDQGTGAGIGYLLSPRHLRDFVNDQYLLGPWAAALFVPGAILAFKRHVPVDRSRVFLAIAAASYLGASFITSDPQLGYPRDWDIFAPAGVAYTVAGLALWKAAARSQFVWWRVLTTIAALSGLHLAVWVTLNHSEPRAMARFATLPLGLGRTEMVIGNWYRRQGNDEEAERWLRRSVEASPGNANSWAFLGQIAGDRQNLPAVIEAYTKAVALRPDKLVFRHNLVLAYEYSKQPAPTIPHYETLCRTEPNLVWNWMGYARALRQTGRAAEARAVLQRGRPYLDRYLASSPPDSAAAAIRSALAE
jgi:tetratricopeptide (TPR) repeat protein